MEKLKERLENGERITHIPYLASKEERQMMIELFGEGIYKGNPVEISVSTYEEGRKKKRLFTQIIRKMNHPSEAAIQLQNEVAYRIVSDNFMKRKMELNAEMEMLVPEYVKVEDIIENFSELRETEVFEGFDESMLIEFKPKAENYKQKLFDRMGEIETEFNYISSTEGLVAEAKKLCNMENFNNNPTVVNEVIRSAVEKIFYDREQDVITLSIIYK